MRRFAIFLGLFFANVAQAGDLPDPKLTPGVINPQVTQSNIRSTICVSGWTKTVRPPAGFTTALKKKQLADPRYLDTDKNPSDYEEDHLISLELGGAPKDPKNLWPELWSGPHGAHAKDRVENALHRAVCSHKLTLRAAQTAIAKDWTAALPK